MSVRCIKAVSVTAVLAVACFTFGCGELVSESREIKELGATIGSQVEVVSPDLVAVEGYGIVGGLRGTGSGDCPPRVRAYLKQYILKHYSEHRADVDNFIGSNNTAVVRVYGVMSTAVLESRHFDVQVAALPGTQTTSLEGGWLYSTELKQVGRFGLATRILGMAEGAVFIDTIDAGGADKRVGYALAGGTVFGEYPIVLVLRKPDYRTANIIRNRLNGRFGPETARAVSSSQIQLKVPAKYGKQKQRFISIVKAMYLAEAEEITEKRIKTFVGKLAVSEDKESSEIALEAIGNRSLGRLVTLLNSGYEEVRFRAARCILNLGSDAGLDTLKTIAMDKDSAYRFEALEAMTAGARRNDAATISRRLLRDEEFSIRLAAYEQLRKIDDISVIRMPIAHSFYLEQITQTQYKTVFVSRSGQARIVLFGAPILCRDNMFVQSANGEITIDSPAGQKFVSLMRKHPAQPKMIGPLRSSLELGDIIQTLCDEPAGKGEQGRTGLGVSYADVIALLKQMCEKGAMEAEFEAGPLPKIE